MKNSLFNQLIYFLTIGILICGLFSFFKEVCAVALIPSGEKKAEEVKEEIIEQEVPAETEEQIIPTTSPPNLEEKPSFEINKEIIILLVEIAILIGIVIGISNYLFRKRKR